MHTVFVTGATGYIGRALVHRFVKRGDHVRCLVRSMNRLGDLEPLARKNRIEIIQGVLQDRESLMQGCLGADWVIHSAAVTANIKESRLINYREVNYNGTQNLVDAAKATGVQRFVHLGGINTVPGKPNSYIYWRWKAEEWIKNGSVPWTIIQPSVLFGGHSEFIAALVRILRVSPVGPIIGNGRLMFQPIWLEDVVTCITQTCERRDLANKTIPVGGPEHLTIEQIVNILEQAMHMRRINLHIPLPLMWGIAWLGTKLLPNPPITTHTLEIFEGPHNITDVDIVKRIFGFQPVSMQTYFREYGIGV